MRDSWLWCARWLVAISLLVCVIAQAQPVRAIEGPQAYVPGEVILRLVPPLLGSVETLVQRIAARFGLHVLDRIDGLPTFRLKIVNNDVSVPVLATLLDAVPGVMYAEPNFIGQTPESIGRGSW